MCVCVCACGPPVHSPVDHSSKQPACEDTADSGVAEKDTPSFIFDAIIGNSLVNNKLGSGGTVNHNIISNRFSNECIKYTYDDTSNATNDPKLPANKFVIKEMQYDWSQDGKSLDCWLPFKADRPNQSHAST